MSLDGKIAGKKGERIQITGSALQHITHAYRKKSDAILTTAKTILHDNPQMNVRDEEVIAKPVYVVDRELNISLDAAIFTTAKSVTLFYGNQLPEDKIKKLSDKNIHKNIRYIAVNAVHEKLDLNEIFTHIGKDGMHDVWVEAGGTFFSELVKEKQVQKMLMYVAPRWLGTGMSAFPEDFSLNLSGKLIHWQQAGDDVFCEVVMT
jgi:diaminohydroxyphosphoribosylaminopyrimidine deaminase/5-amino-6-(5-phosphoribosylamino)uracil reductase